MSYQVLARKYRPQTFEEVVGQEAVVATLSNAIASKRLHHAYLFAGARGIGKTSLARIFAKALNCEKGPIATPCNRCAFCREITEGSSLDVQEIDGASNTSVDDVRELRERLKYLPASARYKIYIIDEVHMLSTSAFNALLKTLEEPPPHAVFLFATTETHKIPATILSRCQRFDLRRIPTEKIREKLSNLAREEKIEAEPDALLMIAREAEGSLRDAQSLLDQAITYGAGKLKAEDVASMLGLVNTSSLHAITAAALQGDAALGLKIAGEVFERGHDLKQFAVQWLGHWRNLLVYRATGDLKSLGELTESERSEVIRESEGVSLGALDLGFHLLHRGVEDLARSEFPKMILEVLVVRLAHVRQLGDLGQMLEGLKDGSKTLPSTALRSTEAREARPSGPSSKAPSPPASNLASASSAEIRFEEFVRRVSSQRPQTAPLFAHVRAFSLSENDLLLKTDPGSIWADLIREKKDILEQMAAEFFGRSLNVAVREEALPGESVPWSPGGDGRSGGGNAPEDPMVRTALDLLNAKVEDVNA